MAHVYPACHKFCYGIIPEPMKTMADGRRKL
jgi:hypothetical protein